LVLIIFLQNVYQNGWLGLLPGRLNITCSKSFQQQFLFFSKIQFTIPLFNYSIKTNASDGMYQIKGTNKIF
jgi:hypothetical protein